MKLCPICRTPQPKVRGFCSKKCQLEAFHHREIAHNRIACAVSKGTLPKASSFMCVDCGKPATGYDHRIYARPMDVVPVCQRCNCQRGRAVEFGGDADAVSHAHHSRTELARSLRLTGLNNTEIATAMKISKQRVGQLLSAP